MTPRPVQSQARPTWPTLGNASRRLVYTQQEPYWGAFMVAASAYPQRGTGAAFSGIRLTADHAAARSANADAHPPATRQIELGPRPALGLQTAARQARQEGGAGDGC